MPLMEQEKMAILDLRILQSYRVGTILLKAEIFLGVGFFIKDSLPGYFIIE